MVPSVRTCNCCSTLLPNALATEANTIFGQQSDNELDHWLNNFLDPICYRGKLSGQSLMDVFSTGPYMVQSANLIDYQQNAANQLMQHLGLTHLQEDS